MMETAYVFLEWQISKRVLLSKMAACVTRADINYLDCFTLKYLMTFIRNNYMSSLTITVGPNVFASSQVQLVNNVICPFIWFSVHRMLTECD